LRDSTLTVSSGGRMPCSRRLRSGDEGSDAVASIGRSSCKRLPEGKATCGMVENELDISS
jgi:hypothetical protein